VCCGKCGVGFQDKPLQISPKNPRKWWWGLNFFILVITAITASVAAGLVDLDVLAADLLGGLDRDLPGDLDRDLGAVLSGHLLAGLLGHLLAGLLGHLLARLAGHLLARLTRDLLASLNGNLFRHLLALFLVLADLFIFGLVAGRALLFVAGRALFFVGSGAFLFVAG